MTGWYRCPFCSQVFDEGKEVWGKMGENITAFCSEACLEKYVEEKRHD